MNRTLVYTALYGGRDHLYPQVAQFPNVDWLLFTDDPTLYVPEPWVMVYSEPEHEHPNLAAKWHRTHPPFERGDYDHCIWIDANMEIRIPSLATQCVAAVRDGLAVWEHPRRDCIVDEMEASLGREAQGGRYNHLPLRQQVQSYLNEGYPLHNGLYATGTFVWTPQAAKLLGQDWYDECCTWGYQDQISFPVVCWRHDIKPGVFPVPQIARRWNARKGWWANDWMLLHDHIPGDGMSAGAWDSHYAAMTERTPYGGATSYDIVAAFVADLGYIEDWGCGGGELHRHLDERVGYIGVDGSATPFADTHCDLVTYRSAAPGIVLRHVLEHNERWAEILDNAVWSFTHKLAIVLFTPQVAVTRIMFHEPEYGHVPVIAFNLGDIVARILDARIDIEEIRPSDTAFGIETLILAVR